MPAMKVLFIDLYRNYGGGEDILLTLAKNLKKRGIEPAVVCHPGSILHEKTKSIGIEARPADLRSPLKAAFELISLVKYIRSNNFSAAQTFGFWGNTLGRIAARAGGGPVLISTCLYIPGTIISERGGGALKRLLNRANYRLRSFTDNLLTALFTDLVITDAAENKKDLVRQGIKADKIKVIYFGLDPEQKPPEEKAAYLQRQGISPGTAVISVIARLTYEKGHLILLEALGRLKQAADFRLFIAGDGEEKEAIEKAVERHGLKNRVIMTGFLEDVPSLLNASDIIVLPSLSEGISRVLIEAMSSGKPVVATDLPAIREVITDKDSGLLFKKGDSAALSEKILFLLKNREAGIKMGQSARTTYEKTFSIESTVSSHAVIYENLLKEKQK